MEDKTFELLTKMYSEFSGRFDGMEKDIKGIKSDVTGLKSDVNELKSDVTGLKSDVKGLKSDVARIGIKLEHNIEPKIQALFDDRDIIHGKLDSIEQKVDVLTSRVDKQDIRISVIKGGKPKAVKG